MPNSTHPVKRKRLLSVFAVRCVGYLVAFRSTRRMGQSNAVGAIARTFLTTSFVASHGSLGALT